MTTDDVTSVDGTSLADQVSWRSYQQGYQGPEYALKHDPFSIFGHRSEDWSRFAHDPLAQFTLIVPDLVHDMHSGPVRAGDTFVRNAVHAIHGRDAHALIFITFDEGAEPGSQHVLTLVIGGKHAVSHRRYDHYSLLRTIEAHFGARCLAAACSARPMADLTG